MWNCCFRNAKRFTSQRGCICGVPARRQGLHLAHTVYTNSRRYSQEEAVVGKYDIHNVYVLNEGKLCHQKYQFMKVNLQAPPEMGTEALQI